MNLKKYFQTTIPILINLQLVLTPTVSFGADDIKAKDVIQGVENVATGILGGIQQGLQQKQQLRLQQQLQQSAAVLQVQPLSPTANPLFGAAGCLILPARGNRPSKDLQCDGTPPLDPMQEALFFQIQQVAENNSKQYEALKVDSNVSSSSVDRIIPQNPVSGAPSKPVGKSCYQTALNNFKVQLEARANLITELKNSIDRQTEVFEKVSEKTLDDIKRGEALLTGKGDEEFLRGLRFEDNFTDPQCASLLSGDDFKSIGDGGGLKAIELELQKQSNQSTEFNGRTKDFKKEIEKVASQLAKEVQRSDLTSLQLEDGVALTSRLGVEKFPAFKALLGRIDTQKQNELKDIERNFQKLGAGKKEKGILQSILSETTDDVGTQIADFERNTKNNCLNGLLSSNFNGAGGFLSRLEDPNVSAKLNREADSAFKNFVSSTLADNTLSIEEKLRLIKAEESRGNNARLTMVTGKSISIRGQQLSASTRLKTSDLIGVFESNCRDIFDNEPNSNGKSKKDIVSSLKRLSTTYQQKKATFASKLQADIKKDLLLCSSDSTTGVAANSCDKALDTQDPNFCFGVAKTCSENMQACFQKTKNEVIKIEKAQDQLAANYKAVFEQQFKNPLTLEFQAFEQNLKAQSQKIDATFKSGTLFKTPEGFSLDLKVSKKNFLEGVPASLKIEDPKKYAEAIKGNLEKLKQSVETHNSEIFAAAQKEMDTILSNYESEFQFWEGLANKCKGLLDSNFAAKKAGVAKQNEDIKKQNEELRGICTKVDALNANPIGGEPGDLADEMLKTAAVQGESRAIGQLRELERIKKISNNEENNVFLSDTSTSKSKLKPLSISAYCQTKEGKEFSKPQCERFEKECSGEKPQTCEDVELTSEKLCISKSMIVHVKGNPQCDNNINITEENIRALDPNKISRLQKTLSPGCIKKSQGNRTCENLEEDLSTYAAQLSQAKAVKKFGQVQVQACNSTGSTGRGVAKKFATSVGQAIGGGIPTTQGLGF